MGEHYAWRRQRHLMNSTVWEDDDSNSSGTQEFTAQFDNDNDGEDNCEATIFGFLVMDKG